MGKKNTKKTESSPKNTKHVRNKAPRFTTEDEEREFWAKQDSADYVDWDSAERVTLPDLKPSTTTISLRLPAFLLAELKMLANKQDVPYQSLMKVYLTERIAHERHVSFA